MYHSRLNFTNGLVSAALDSVSGEPLELVLESTRENILKSNFPHEAAPLKVCLANGRELRPAKYAEIRQNPSLKPDIRIVQGENEARAVISCPQLVDMDTTAPADVSAVWTLELPEQDTRMRWRLTLENRQDCVIDKVYFPFLHGIFMGDDWTQDTLYMPIHSGDKTKNPTEVMSQSPSAIYWKWQEYRYTFFFGGPYGVKNEKWGCWEREAGYSGPCSMLFMILTNEELGMGVYLTCRNDALRMKSIRAATYGKAMPGMSLAIMHRPFLNQGSIWHSEENVLMLYEGTWHLAADEYRAWRESRPMPRIQRPDWFMHSPGLVAHYDFKYQGGGIVHTFKDIPALYEQARSFGLHHLLLSGWHEDGFDNGFPMYQPSHELGSEQELIQALRHVKEQGGHTAFYVNSRLFNLRYRNTMPALYEEGAVHQPDGQHQVEQYGADELRFACMCTGSRAWQDKLTGTVRYLTKTIGADSMYLDQLGMGHGYICHNQSHLHGDDPAAWNKGYAAILQRIREDVGELGLLYEGVSDIHGSGAAGQLISTMFFNGAYPELYKYTFPDQVLVDMMNPRGHSGMRPSHLGQKSTFLLYRAFCVGSYLWVYDLEEDNTFRRDAEQLERLKKVIALRQHWLDEHGHGLFRDTLEFVRCPDEKDTMARTFRLKNGLLIAFANEKKRAFSLDIRWDHPGDPQVTARLFQNPDAQIPLSWEKIPGGVRVRITDELGYIVLQ